MRKKRKILFLAVCLAILFFVGRDRLAEFYYRMGHARYGQQAYREAANYFHKALGLKPSAELHYALANIYLEEGAGDKALQEYREALRQDRRYVPAYQSLAEIYFLRESYKEAFDLAREAEAALPNDPDIRALKKKVAFEYFLNAALAAFEKGTKFEARELLKGALEANPQSAAVHYLLALSFDDGKDFYRVEDHLREALRLDPKFFLARSFLGDVFSEKGDFERAVQEYQFSLALHPDDPVALNNLGLAYMHLERYGTAIPYLEKALAVDPSNIQIRYNLAAVYRDRGMTEKAVENFKNLLAMRPDYPDAHNDLGDIYRKQARERDAFGEYQAAIAWCEAKLLDNPEDPFVLTELAYAYNEIREHEKARGLIDQALRLAPRHQKAYLTLANIYKNSNRPADALEALNKAKQLSSQEYLFIEDAIANVREQLARQMA